MKNVLIFFLFFANLNLLASSEKVKERGVQNYTTYSCKRKLLPIEVKYLVSEKDISLEIFFENNIANFHISKVRGIDGASVGEGNTHPGQDFKKSDKDLINIDYSKGEGLGYVVFEAKGEVGGVMKAQMIVIPVGTLSKTQKMERQKNIIDLDSSSPGTNSKPEKDAVRKFHRMKL